MFEEFYRKLAKSIAVNARQWDGFQEIADKMENIPDSAYQDIQDRTLPDHSQDAFNTVIQGDLMGCNMFFKYDKKNRPIEARWVSANF